MKLISKLLLSFALITFISCGNDDDNGSEPSIDNEFSVENTNYSTPNAYLILDDAPVYTNKAGLAFMNGSMREDNINGSSISTNTTHGIVLFMDFFGASTVNSEQQVVANITNGSTYILDDETRAITTISTFNNTYTHSGTQYGDPDDAGATLYELNTLGNGTITIHSFTVDHIARTGTVDCDYSFTDENNVVVFGQYIGTFEIINEF